MSEQQSTEQAEAEHDDSNAWRVIITDSESASGVAPVCPKQTDRDGEHNTGYGDLDVLGVYDCCPQPHIECWSERSAPEVARILTEANAEVCT